MTLRSTSIALLTLLSMSAAPVLAQSAPDVVRSVPVQPQHTARITGRVVDESGKPVGDLSLRAVISDADFGHLTAPFWTGYSYNGPPPEDRIGLSMVCPNIPTAPDGSYTFSALTTARYYLMEGGNLNAGSVVSSTVVQAQEGETVRAPDIVIARAVTIRGQVVSKEDGKPLPGVFLRYFDAAHSPEVSWFMDNYRDRRGTLKTDKDGRFTLHTAPGPARFFVAGSGASFQPKELLLTGRQQKHWPAEKDVYGQQVWGVKSGADIYAANRWVEVEQQGRPVQELAPGHWVQTQVEAQQDVSLVLRLDKLAFKNGKTPVVPASSFFYEGDPRK